MRRARFVTDFSAAYEAGAKALKIPSKQLTAKQKAEIRFRNGGKTTAPSDYTDAQYAALDDLKQKTPKLKYGAARKEFVNKVLLIDGTISDDLQPVRKAAAHLGPKDPGNLFTLEKMVEQERFLIVVDSENVPVIYFQCATPDNPDIERAE